LRCTCGTVADLVDMNSLAMAEMTTLLTTLYMNYTTTEQERQKGASPGITSRFEVFYDEKFDRISVSLTIFKTGYDKKLTLKQEHACYVDFHKR